MNERAPGTGRLPLSTRQSEILALIALGKSNKEIASQLGLTTGTVKQHVHALFRKLGVTNRTMAVARAAALDAPSREPARPAPEADPVRRAAALPESVRYARRLLTVVVVEPRTDPARTPREAAETAARLATLRERIERLAFALDARAEHSPVRGTVIWFGQPSAHGDDAQRAVAFARALFIDPAAPPPVACGVGIGTTAEIVGEGEVEGVAHHRAFRLAAQLAAFAQPGRPLACARTARLALLEPASAQEAAAVADAPEGAVIVARPRAPSAGAARQWGGLPFLAEVVAGLRRNRCQWLAVESWPPEAGTRLLDALADCLAAARVPVHTLWMPLPSSGIDVGERLAAQLSVQAPDALARRESLAEALARWARAGPAAVVVHGIDALQLLKAALGERGIEMLSARPLLIVAGAMQTAGTPRTLVRLLGSRPDAAPFVRVMRLEVPADRAPALAEGIRPDVQALLDTLSSEARAIARLAAGAGSPEVGALALALGLARGEVLTRCRELEASGLLAEREGRVEFRDPATAAAVRASLADQG